MSKFNYFDLLADHLILNLFQYLDIESIFSISLTCKRFLRIGNNISLKREIYLIHNKLDNKLINQAIRFGNEDLIHFQILSGINFLDKNEFLETGLTTRTVKNLYRRCKNLKFLLLDSICSYTFVFFVLPKRLVHLSLRNCIFNFHCLFRKPINHLNNGFINQIKFLKCFDLSYSTLFESRNCLILNYFKQLNYLYLEGLHRINNGGLLDISSKIMNNLFVLDIEGTETSGEILKYIFFHCIQLKELYIGHTCIDQNLKLFEKSKIKSNLIQVLCVYCLKLDLESIYFLNENLSQLNKIILNESLFLKINCEDLLKKLEKKLVIREIPISMTTCFHFKQHRCKEYSK